MNIYVIEESARKELGNYIKDRREAKTVGLNQLVMKIGVVNSLISKLENGITQKISPFLLIKVAQGLGIDYKELYKIVGYLSEEDFKEAEVLKKENYELKEELLKYKESNEKQESKNILNFEIIDASGLSTQEIEHLKNYIEFMKTKKERE